jgi:class 3 adenylate cyclase
MEPRIQYTRTADGVNIAYYALGKGAPVVQMPGGALSHIRLEWQAPQIRRWYERVAQERMIVRYDGRGTGLSDRQVSDYSLETQLLDLKAVVERLGVTRVLLGGIGASGPAAIAYAARYPRRVSHLILWNAWARASDLSAARRALLDLADTDWTLYADALAGLAGGQPEEVSAASRFFRESVTPEAAKAMEDAALQIDVTPLLPKVTSPTLVLHREESRLLDVEVAKRLASQIPNARLVLLEGSSGFASIGDMDETIAIIDDFLGDGEDAAAETAPSGLVTIFFTDMEGSTTLTQRLGDAAAQDVLRTHNTIIRDALKAYDGSETKHTGDGIMASFSSASRALECSIAIQRAFASHNDSTDEPIRVRIGLNAGEPVAEDEDLFGTAVQLAARICAHAEPGQILAPIVVRELAAGKRFLFADLGDVALRGFEDPVRLFELRWREDA